MKLNLATFFLVMGIIVVSLMYAKTWSYRFVSSSTHISQPQVWFEDPRYPSVIVELRLWKTDANVTVKLNEFGVDLISRVGERFDLTNKTTVDSYFELYPATGCSYEVTLSGVKVTVVGNPQGGLYSGCVLRRKASFSATNITVSFIMRTDDATPIDGIRGVVFFDPATGYYYMAGLKNNVTGWFFGIYQYLGRTIREPGGPSLPPIKEVKVGSPAGRWFIISFSIYFIKDTAIVKAWLYDLTLNGVLVGYVEATVSNPIPISSYGVGVYQIRNKPSAVFQMIASTTRRVALIVSGLTYCCNVYLYDSSNNLVASAHVNETGVAELTLTNPAVINAVLKVVCNEDVYVKKLDVVLGGDVYTVYKSFEGPVLLVFSMLNNVFEGYVTIIDFNCYGPIYYIELGLWNKTYLTRLNAKLMQIGSEIIVVNPNSETIQFTSINDQWVGNVTLRAKLHIRSFCVIKGSYVFTFNKRILGSLRIQINLS